MIDIQPSTIRARLQARIARSFGEEFRALCTLMFVAHPSRATSITHLRNDGTIDRDWYEIDSGRYYHIHAPDSLDEVSAVSSIVGVLQDLFCRFADTAVYPRGITEFYFVVNDAYRMTPATCPAMYRTLEACRHKYRLRRCRPFLANDLEDALMALDEKQIHAIAGYVPDIRAATCQSDDLIAQILSHVATLPRSKLRPNAAMKEPCPTLGFVRLMHTEAWLSEARRLAANVRQVFRSQPQLCEADIRARLDAAYQNSRLRNFHDIQGGPTRDDQRFEYLVSELTPHLDGSDPALSRALQAAAIAVIGFYAAGSQQFDVAVRSDTPEITVPWLRDELFRRSAATRKN